MNNETIDYTLVTTNRKSCWIRAVIIGVSVIKRFSLYEFSLWGRDFVSVVRIIECMGIFPGQWTVRIREVSVRRGSTVYLASRFCHITLILYELRWLPVTFRIEFKVVIITHKAIYGTAPNYLSSLVNFKPNSSYSLRSNNKYLLSNPNFRTLPTLGDRAFVAAAPKLWNNPPLDVRCTSDFQVFKRNLKTHLFKKAFSDIML